MAELERDISSEDFKIGDIVKLLQEDKLLVPTFQREFVWDPSSILKLWDSIFRFYPIGSILYWETDSYLHTHRKLGGYAFPHDEDTVRKFKDWKYILDGQQRCTSFLVCMLGGKGRVENNEDFDYTLYFDATTAEFFFPDQLQKRAAHVADSRLLIRVRDVPGWRISYYREIASAKGYTPDVERNLEQLQRIFTDYRLSVTRIRGVEVNEVCEIFERINQEGKRLHPVDIIVARTYRNPDEEKSYPGFYLRDNLEGLKAVLTDSGSRWRDLDDLAIIQMVAMCLRKESTEKRSPFGITPASLDNLTTEHLEENWEACSKSIFKTVKFLTDQQLVGPDVLPFAYLALPLCYYFHGNESPNRDVAYQWFWRTVFGLDDFRASTQVYDYSEGFFASLEEGRNDGIEPLTLSRSRFVQANYYYRNALTRAVLAWLAHCRPVDFTDAKAEVLDNVYLLVSQAPNLHHIYPQSFLREVGGLPSDAPVDSLMNICYLRAETNLAISNRDPLEYLKEYRRVKHFRRILESHLIPAEFVDSVRFAPADYRKFLFARAQLFCESIRDALPDVTVRIVD